MTNIRDLDWRLLPEQAAPGPLQMAYEEVAAETAGEDGVATVRVYRWDPSTLSLGYRQDAESVDWSYCDREGITVTRRQTGGGGIYHDRHADISYSIVAPADAVPGDLMECYELFCQPVLDAFERMGVDARFADREHPPIHQPACYLRKINPAHDILAYGDEGTADTDDEPAEGVGRKISGNAQYRQRDAVVQHGSLSYDLAVDAHLGTFSDPGIDADRFRERVTSIREQAGIDRSTAVDALETALAEWSNATVGEWTDDELARAREIAGEKYETDAWTRDRTDPIE